MSEERSQELTRELVLERIREDSRFVLATTRIPTATRSARSSACRAC